MFVFNTCESQADGDIDHPEGRDYAIKRATLSSKEATDSLSQTQPSVLTARIAMLIMDSFSFSSGLVKTRFYYMQVTGRAA